MIGTVPRRDGEELENRVRRRREEDDDGGEGQHCHGR